MLRDPTHVHVHVHVPAWTSACASTYLIRPNKVICFCPEQQYGQYSREGEQHEHTYTTRHAMLFWALLCGPACFCACASAPCVSVCVHHMFVCVCVAPCAVK